jgi:acyl-CoA thioesterase-1
VILADGKFRHCRWCGILASPAVWQNASIPAWLALAPIIPKSNGSGPIKFAHRQFITPILAALIILIAHVAAQAEAVNIVALGASNTWGWGVSRHHGWPEQLQEMLRAKGYDVNLKNAGVVADTTSGMLRRIHKVVPEGTHIVIFQPGSNDLRFFGTKEQRAENIAAIVSQLSARNIKVIVFDWDMLAHYYQSDGIHFTTEGHSEIASRLLPEVISAIEPLER